MSFKSSLILAWKTYCTTGIDSFKGIKRLNSLKSFTEGKIAVSSSCFALKFSAFGRHVVILVCSYSHKTLTLSIIYCMNDNFVLPSNLACAGMIALKAGQFIRHSSQEICFVIFWYFAGKRKSIFVLLAWSSYRFIG